MVSLTNPLRPTSLLSSKCTVFVAGCTPCKAKHNDNKRSRQAEKWTRVSPCRRSQAARAPTGGPSRKWVQSIRQCKPSNVVNDVLINFCQAPPGAVVIENNVSTAIGAWLTFSVNVPTFARTWYVLADRPMQMYQRPAFGLSSIQRWSRRCSKLPPCRGTRRPERAARST
jgi:hypothetical protein